MADIFVSYARADKARVQVLVGALETQGWSVWWDREIAPGQEFDEQITREIETARAVIVVWTPASVASRWVRGEARLAADRGTLVPVRFDDASLPLDARAVHTTDLDDWDTSTQSAHFQELLRALMPLLAGSAASASATPVAPPAPGRATGVSICVLPFANMSGDIEQEYFSDGISEDIITDLSKVSALAITSRNSAFAFKGKHVDLKQVARQLGVSYVLEGSVRKVGNRVRITAQLIDAAHDNHIWAERYDRDLSDIFALQDEISERIVSALKVRLLPEEKRAIEHRGTSNPEAYDLYLMARQVGITGNLGSASRHETIIKFCERAVEIDPKFARAWAMIAGAQGGLQTYLGRDNDGGRAAAERALELDPELAEAHAANARVCATLGEFARVKDFVDAALRLDPESYDANAAAANWNYRTRHFIEAIPFYEKAAALMENDYMVLGQVVSCYKALGDEEGARRAAARSIARIEKIVLTDPSNGAAMSWLVGSLAALGQHDRARSVAKRALLLDPDNWVLHYNLACTMILELKDFDTGLDFLAKGFAKVRRGFLSWVKNDPDLDAVRDHPRYKALIADAEARVAAGDASG